MLTDDQLLSSADPSVRLSVFEGPLDLLLFLIRRNEISIHDIPIVEVTRQYLAILKEMEELNLEIAGEFFVMASTLMYIKSRLLLPKEKRAREENAEEEGEDPRWELVQQLIEYRAFKEAAGQLEDLIDENADRVPRRVGPGDAEEEVPLRPADQLEIWNAFNRVLRRLADRIVVGRIEDDPVTVADRMEFVLARLRERSRFRFSELFSGGYTLNTLAATFLAVLELTRVGRVAIRQERAFGDILCEALQLDETLENSADGAIVEG
ncbi:MAG: segregation and condensation protein A [Puniceicoccaceae bacterium]